MKEKQPKIWAGLLMLCLMVVLLPVSKFLVNFYGQYIYDLVTIVPTEKQNPISQGNEIWVEGYSVGGIKYDINIESVYSGAWLEHAEMLGWRNYNQEANTTQSITLKIPRVKGTKLVFQGNIWRGMAEVTCNDVTQVVDCYRNTTSEEMVSIEVGSADGFGWTILFYLVQYGSLVGMTFGMMIILRKLYSWMINKMSERQISIFADCVFLAALVPVVVYFLAMLSISSTPFSPDYFGADAAVFNVVADTWLNGGIPYRDAFDHKGPLLFAVYALGRKLDTVCGVFVLQCIALYASLVIAYLIGRKFRNRIWGIIAVVFTLFCFIPIIDEGALSEEFNLPFLMLSMYSFVTYMLQIKQTGTVEHKPISAAIHGIAFGVSTYMRLTNGIVVCCQVFCIVVYLLLHKKIRNLFENACGFLCGFGIVILPVMLYFMYHNALYDMLWGTLLYNLQYAGAEVHHTKEQLLQIGSYLIPVFVAMAVAVEQKTFVRNTIWFSGVVLTLWMLKSQLYPHYYIICLPFASLAVGLLSLKSAEPFLWNRYRLVYYFCTALVLTTMVCNSYRFINERIGWTNALRYNTSDDPYETIVKEQCEEISLEDRDKVIGYNLDSTWYLHAGIQPCYKYFTMHDWQGSHSPKLVEENISLFQSLEAKWIIVGFSGIGQEEIAEIINTSYQLVRSDRLENGKLSMYLRVDN